MTYLFYGCEFESLAYVKFSLPEMVNVTVFFTWANPWVPEALFFPSV